MTRHESSTSKRMRRGNALVWVGALIFFVTYIVKDLWRDDLRGKLDAIGTAKTAWLMRVSGGVEENSLFTIKSAVEKLIPDTKEHRQSKLEAKISELRALQHWMAVWAKNDRDLLQVVGMEGSPRGTESELKNAERMSQDLGPVPEPFPIPRDDPSFQTALNKYEQAIETWSNKLDGCHAGMIFLGMNLISFTEEKEREGRRQLQYVNRISIGAFAIGWGVALYGRLRKQNGFDGGS